MIVPAAVYIGINVAAGHPENIDGWAVPIATDIAFALAVLAVLSTHLPSALRTFLLTLAVVDDLLAITVIAVFFTDHLSLGPLALSLIPDRIVRGGGAARCTSLVAVGPACRGRLGAGACQRGARHRRRRSARIRRAGARPPRASHRRAFRTHHAAGVGGLRGPGVRLLRGGRDGGRLVGARRVATAPDHRRRDRRLGDWQTPRRLRHRIPVGQVHPRQPGRRPRVARRTRRRAACWDRVHSFVIDRRVGLRSRHRSGSRRQDRCAGRVRCRRSAGCGCVAEPQRRLPAHSRTRDRSMPTTTECPTSTALEQD